MIPFVSNALTYTNSLETPTVSADAEAEAEAEGEAAAAAAPATSGRRPSTDGRREDGRRAEEERSAAGIAVVCGGASVCIDEFAVRM